MCRKINPKIISPKVSLTRPCKIVKGAGHSTIAESEALRLFTLYWFWQGSMGHLTLHDVECRPIHALSLLQDTQSLSAGRKESIQLYCISSKQYYYASSSSHFLASIPAPLTGNHCLRVGGFNSKFVSKTLCKISINLL